MLWKLFDMRMPYLPLLCRRLVWGATVSVLALAPVRAQARAAAQLQINAWEFDRGNAKVVENPRSVWRLPGPPS